jgi:large subunit ribosomal protein L32
MGTPRAKQICRVLFCALEDKMAKHPVPKKKTSKSKRDMRRSHHALVAPNLTTCKNCGNKKQQHVVCPACGYYDGRQVLAVAEA